MVNVELLREEALLHSVKGTKRPILSADDVDACHTTSRSLPVLPADILLLVCASVVVSLFRRLVIEDPEPQGNWYWQNEIPKNCVESL